VTIAERRARFLELHAAGRLFVMPNPWDVGSARLLASLGFPALATTSSGFAWSRGKPDGAATRDELVAHVESVVAATELPLNVDSERCFPDAPGGVEETVRLLDRAGAAGFSVEDYDPASDSIEPIGVAAERVAAVASAAHALPAPLVVTGRAENHIHGVDDLGDTIARLRAYREAGADVLYAPGLADVGSVSAVVGAVDAPVNVLLLPHGPPVRELAAAGVRRVSTGGALAAAAYGAALQGAHELLAEGTAGYSASAGPRGALVAALTFTPAPGP
jgi:2-methylisocitrate lyase-like PEP mutase family enzyme